jgi:hypothetical protein
MRIQWPAMEFTGLTPDEFANYAEPRSRSNVYSRARLEVKQMLLAASTSLSAQLGEQGQEFEVTASDHHPSVWNRKVVDRQFVFFSRGSVERDEMARLVDHERSLASTLMDPTPYFRHAHLCLCVSEAGFEAAVKLHWQAWVDRENLLARLKEPAERGAFVDMLSSLPEEYVIGVEGGTSVPAHELDAAALDGLVEELGRTEGMLSVGLVVPPDRAGQLGPDLMGVASVAFMLLEPVYEVVSWSEEDDFISLRDREQAIGERRRATAEEHRREREAFETLKKERREEQARRFEEEREEKIDHQAYKQASRRAARAAAAQRQARDEEQRQARDEEQRQARGQVGDRAGPRQPRAGQGRRGLARRQGRGLGSEGAYR